MLCIKYIKKKPKVPIFRPNYGHQFLLIAMHHGVVVYVPLIYLIAARVQNQQVLQLPLQKTFDQIYHLHVAKNLHTLVLLDVYI